MSRKLLILSVLFTWITLEQADRNPMSAAPSIRIIVRDDAEEIERFAADELAGMLEKLFVVNTTVEADDSQSDCAAVIHVGRSNRTGALAQALGSDHPELSDQGLLLRRVGGDPPTLVISGGSPVAVMWAVYELGQRWGIRYLVDSDVYPARGEWSGLPDLDVIMEPNMRIRCWRLVNALPHGPVSWSWEENRRFLRQIAKMKYNRIYCALWPLHPNVHYTFRGLAKPPGDLYFGLSFPIDEDTIAREKYPGMKQFTNPEFVGADSPEEVVRRGTELIQKILSESRQLGLETSLWILPFSWPKEFMEVLPGSEPVHQLGDLTAGPGANQSMDDPLLRDMITTIVRAYIETYPDIKYLYIGMPEWRGWAGQSAEAYQRLVEHHRAADLGTYEELCAQARARTTFPGGGGRVEAMLKGDLASLWFFDSLLRERDLLSRPGGGEDIRLVYNGVVAELFPLLGRMVPPGGEVLNFVDYTASRVLKQRDLLQQVPQQNVPASLIFTLADDNVGILPQLATGSLHTLLGDLRKNGWSGFSTRYWTVGDLDPTVHYLARASWDESMTPLEAYDDQVKYVCGPSAVKPALEAFAIIEQITIGLDQHGLGFGFPVPGMMRKHYNRGGLSEHLKKDHQLYREALVKMQQAYQLSRAEGRHYAGYFVSRLRFAVRYLDAAESFGATGVAEKAGRKDEARRSAQTAYEAIRDALETYAAVAKDHGDLGSIAAMNEYCYRPIRDKRNELK